MVIMKALYLSIVVVALVACHKSDPIPESEPNYFSPIDLAKLSLDSTQIPENFYLYSEYLAKPISSSEWINQSWKRDSKTNELKLILDEKYEIDSIHGANTFQIWFRLNNSEHKDLIEVEIQICPTEELLEEITYYYTQDAFAAVFIQTGVPLFGKKSWIPKDEQTNGSFTVMFVRYNVFIRLFVNTHENTNESRNITEELAKKLESRIKSEAVVNREYGQ